MRAASAQLGWVEGGVLGDAQERVALNAQELVEVELAVGVEVGLCEELPHARDVAALAHRAARPRAAPLLEVHQHALELLPGERAFGRQVEAVEERGRLLAW